jgi:hypothetical protein
VLGHQLDALLEQGDPILLLGDTGLEGWVKVPAELYARAWPDREQRDKFLEPLAALLVQVVAAMS